MSFVKLNKDIRVPQVPKGRFEWINVNKLCVDRDNYQRNAGAPKVESIRKNFSWLAFVVLCVVRRPDGAYYVYDGGHRLEALRKLGIEEAPCIVFDMDNMTDEAKAFLLIATNRKAMSAVDKHKAKIHAGDPAAILVAKLISEAGRNLSSGGTDANSVKCIARLEVLATNEPALLKRIWPTLVRICDGEVMHEHIVGAIAYIERNADGASMTEPRWTKRLDSIGYKELRQACVEGMRFKQGASGEKVWATGVVERLNCKIRKDPLVLKDLPNGAHRTQPAEVTP